MMRIWVIRNRMDESVAITLRKASVHTKIKVVSTIVIAVVTQQGPVSQTQERNA